MAVVVERESETVWLASNEQQVLDALTLIAVAEKDVVFAAEYLRSMKALQLTEEWENKSAGRIARERREQSEILYNKSLELGIEPDVTKARRLAMLDEQNLEKELLRIGRNAIKKMEELPLVESW